MIHATAVVALRAINSFVWLMRARTSFKLWCHAQAPKTAVDRPKAKHDEEADGLENIPKECVLNRSHDRKYEQTTQPEQRRRHDDDTLASQHRASVRLKHSVSCSRPVHSKGAGWPPRGRLWALLAPRRHAQWLRLVVAPK